MALITLDEAFIILKNRYLHAAARERKRRPKPPPPLSAGETEEILVRCWEKACRRGEAGPSDEPKNFLARTNDPWTILLIETVDGTPLLGAARRYHGDEPNRRTGLASAARVAFQQTRVPQGSRVSLFTDPEELPERALEFEGLHT